MLPGRSRVENAFCHRHTCSRAARTQSMYLCSSEHQSTGILPSDRQGSYVVDASTQGTAGPESQTSNTWEKFWLPAVEVQQLLKDNNMTEDELLHSLITPASSLARPPISSFHVGYASPHFKISSQPAEHIPSLCQLLFAHLVCKLACLYMALCLRVQNYGHPLNKCCNGAVQHGKLLRFAD